MLFPEYLEPLKKEAEKLFLEGSVAEIIFSGPTYQVLAAKDTWVFVQLDPDNQVKDIFCQCDQCQEEGACVHMALALLAITKDETLPLHIQFEHSPFFAAFSPLTQKGFSLDVKKEKNKLSIGKNVALSGPETWLKALCKELSPKEETEETSIKFSDLSEEEIENWRKGIFSQRLRFELSPYADIAKKLFLFSYSHPPSFKISMQKKQATLSITWTDRSLTLTLLTDEHLSSLLDTLPPDRTTPRLFPLGGLELEKFELDEKSLSCQIFLSGKKLEHGEPIGKSHWSYSPEHGFIKKPPHTKSISLSSQKEIVEFLSTHVAEEAKDVHYSIDVDAQKGLTLTPYLLTPHDLDKATFLNSWVWKDTFFKVKNLRWPKKKVAPHDTEEFITHNRHWLSLFPGFQVHEYPAKHALSYHVDTTGALSFTSRVVSQEKNSGIAFGKWFYIKKSGFFLQESASPFPTDPIPPHRVAEFMRKHADQLRELPGFFSDHAPIHSVGLDIFLTKKNQIELTPQYKWDDPKYEATSFFYDDFGYVPALGFFLLPTLLAQTNLMKTISPSDKDAWEGFFLEQLPRLKTEFHCTVDPRLEPPKELSLVCDSLSAEEDLKTARLPHFWEALFHWESEKGKVSSHELMKAYIKKMRFYPSQAGLLDLTNERFGWLSSVPLLKNAITHQLATTDLLKIRAHEEFLLGQEVSSQTQGIIHRLLDAVPQTEPTLSALISELRSYQQKGVEWLWYLYTNGLSGLLCDDMGVGKTHQAMGLICAINALAKKEGRKAHFLILCPTSLFWHWKEKIETVLPHLSIFPYVGGTRFEQEFQEDEDIFLTTYGIWRNEVSELKKIPFELAIFDELQIAKNHVSQIWAALTQVKAAMRLGLTGTPIENNIRELKSLFDLLLPGYLPKTTIPKPIEKKTSTGKKELLTRYAHPFILRRRKQDVLLDLPPKTEEILTTTLLGEQKVLYRQIAARQSSHIVQQLQDETTPIPYMHIFALLSALKQICNHPASYLRDVENYKEYDSGKWEAFTELLEEAQESGQKVIVFSHYLAMLDIISLHLKSKNITFSEIRGSTKQRGEAVSRFQKDPACTVFLGSLHAAGLGIDLTAGSVVIHYDRWWNAARENQATDRAHRIGQTRGVMVYKLLTTSTVEERIDELITQKAQLFEDIIKFDDHRVMKQFNRHELLSLLTNIDSV